MKCLPWVVLVEEAPYYHDAFGNTVYGRFKSPKGAGPSREVRLRADEIERKRAMLACHSTQREVLRRFDPTIERVRRAPRYDFTTPPHAGRLHYERWGWRLTGAAFRARVADAIS